MEQQVQVEQDFTVSLQTPLIVFYIYTMLPSSARQAVVSVLLMSGVYVSNLIFNNNLSNSTETVSEKDSKASYAFQYYNLPSLSSTDNERPKLGACRLSIDSLVPKIIEPYYNDQVFYSDALGRHCRVKLNVSVADDGCIWFYGDFKFKIDQVYKSDTIMGDNIDNRNPQQLSFRPYRRTNDDYVYEDVVDRQLIFEFVNKTSIELSFNPHPYDDVSSSNDGIILYAIRDVETLYIIIIAEQLKIYAIDYKSEQTLSRNYEFDIYKVLRYESDCSKYVHCTNHVKSIKIY